MHITPLAFALLVAPPSAAGAKITSSEARVCIYYASWHGHTDSAAQQASQIQTLAATQQAAEERFSTAINATNNALAAMQQSQDAANASMQSALAAILARLDASSTAAAA